MALVWAAGLQLLGVATARDKQEWPDGTRPDK